MCEFTQDSWKISLQYPH